jgi:RimJ/RimL family protein N-acetyltransferase
MPEAQGTGQATEALSALIRLVFESEPEVDAVWTNPMPENLASRRLYERCGLEPMPVPTHLNGSAEYWELHREDWAPG